MKGKNHYIVVFRLFFVSIVFSIASALSISAETMGKTHNLKELKVEAKRNNNVTSTAPVQSIGVAEIRQLGSLQLSDVAKHFSGVTIKDYGGIGGLKTISVRSLGVAHTAVSYDGITLSDCQTGQIDIGRFSTDNVEMLSLCNGQSDIIFTPARLMASASSLNIVTLRPQFADSTLVHGNVSLKGGSFGLFNSSLSLDLKISKYLSNRFSAEYLYADGQYPYTLEYGPASGDSTSREKRKNSDVRNFRLEDALFLDFGKGGSGNLKVYYYDSERGLPGATIFYNTDNFSSQRIWDKTFFAQSHYVIKPVRKLSLQVNAKYNYGYLRYLDPTYLNSEGKEENSYKQQEYYLSFSALYELTKQLLVSASSDAFVNTLDANLVDFSYPRRFTSLTAINAKGVLRHFTAIASLLFTQTDEHTDYGDAAANQQKLSPYLSFSYRPFFHRDFYLRAFCKNIFRLPTFNDLYYSRIGNSDLKPEDTRQYNIGLTYQMKSGEWLTDFNITMDAYHNDVKNKIVAYPTKNIYQWTMLNYGKVSINGLDLTVDATLRASKYVLVKMGAAHTYMRVLNVTDKSSREYKNQLPYTPRVSGAEHLTMLTPWVELGYNLVWSGKRYAVNQNYAENRLSGYFDHDLSVAHTFDFARHRSLRLSAECLNFTDKNYAVVRYFPMPGRSYRATLKYEF